MSNWILRQVSLVLKVPPEPQPPIGAPGSVQIFRAGKNYYKLRLASWALAQVGAFAAIVFWALVLFEVEEQVHEELRTRGKPPALTAETFVHSVTNSFTQDQPPAKPAADPTAPAQAGPPPAVTVTTPSAAATAAAAESVKPEPSAKKSKTKFRPPRIPTDKFAGFKRSLVELGLRLPPWAFPLIWVLKVLGFLAYLAQIPVTYVMRRLDYELRWYIVTDRSLRIRAGIVRLQESTMSFANLQQVEVKQNPIQRLLGLANVHVQSAGGGGDHSHGEHAEHDSLHTGIFHSVDNATEIRDVILERLRVFRQAGLGDPDDHHDHFPAAGGGTTSSRDLGAENTDALAAAREVLAEARALRQVI